MVFKHHLIILKVDLVPFKLSLCSLVKALFFHAEAKGFFIVVLGHALMLLVLDVLRLKCLFDIIIIEHLITLMKHCLRYLHNCLMLRDLLWIKHHALTCDAGLRWVSVKVDWLLHLR